MDLNFTDGQILLFNKPYVWTSFDLVRKVKFLLQNKLKLKKLKVGHAGTLDPLASGLLIVCTGKFTKKIDLIQAQPKEYIATIKLGATTPSFDLETEIDQEYPFEHISDSMIFEKLKNFIGEQDQIPPIFSAKRVDGKRAYEYARSGEELIMKPSHITIYDMEMLEYNAPILKVRVACSKGTYIRSLARDIGLALNSGGHLTNLVRTKIGDYSVENAMNIEDFEKQIQDCI
jgi:tRNA pseudouridine55 synthase